MLCVDGRDRAPWRNHLLVTKKRAALEKERRTPKEEGSFEKRTRTPYATCQCGQRFPVRKKGRSKKGAGKRESFGVTHFKSEKDSVKK